MGREARGGRLGERQGRLHAGVPDAHLGCGIGEESVSCVLRGGRG